MVKLEFRYATIIEEYAKLSAEQRNELREFRKSHNLDTKSDGSSKKKTRFASDVSSTSMDPHELAKLVSAAVATQLATNKKAEEKAENDRDDAAAGAYLLSLVQAADPKPSAASTTAKTPAISLQNILRRTKRG